MATVSLLASKIREHEVEPVSAHVFDGRHVQVIAVERE